jgi:class 3 adenylate cyclase
MPGIIEGYNYDIFISYRQKDNKYDGWVTEFVENLKKELESTSKEDISVYFDVNPHDGLLETHDVDESLKEKLKCLIFIPIISLTYCDPKSFAWEHEFKPFIENSSKDQFGLKLRLPGGNVANRVLPIRIHDIDNEDIKLLESTLGSYLRGVEFIYKSPGVNRPLRAKEENPAENLNRTIYRDQINKVALAVKELIGGVKNPQTTGEVKDEVTTAYTSELAATDKTRDTGRQTPRVSSPKPAGRKRDAERRLATIVFAEIAEYDKLHKSTDEEELAMLMKSSFELFDLASQHHKGKLKKISASNYMVLFGLPTAGEESTEKAIHFSLDLINRLDRLKKENRLSRPLSLKIGINTGEVIADELTIDNKAEYSVVGDTVNFASQLKNLSGESRIIVGPLTYKFTKKKFDFKSLEPVRTDVKNESVSIYELLSVKGKKYGSELTGERMVFSELVGREKELGKLQNHVLNLLNGKGSLVSVIGEAGIGKSRLIEELQKKDEISRVTFLKGRALSTGKNLSFHPVIDMLRKFAGIIEEDNEADSFVKFERLVQKIHPDGAAEIFPFFATLMGLDLTGRYAQRLNIIAGEALERLIYKNIRDFFIKAAEANPVVIVIEDLHWADLSSIGLMESLFRLSEDHDLLFINVFRPGYPETSDRVLSTIRNKYPDRHEEIIIEELSQEQSEALFSKLLKTNILPQKLNVIARERAEGNPFFLEEVVRSFIDDGTVIIENGAFKISGKIDNFVIPETISELLMSRIDKLEENARSLLKMASVIGRNFYFKILAELTNDKERIADLLDDLKGVQLIVEQENKSEVEYSFKHALVQQTVYGTLLGKQRKELHLKVARAIERAFRDRLPDFIGTLAYHYSMAGEWDDAEKYLILSGEKALRSSASSEALNYFRDALAIYRKKHGTSADQKKIAMLEKNIGVALYNKGHFIDAADHFEKTCAYHGLVVPKNTAATMFKILIGTMNLLFKSMFPSRIGRRIPSGEELEMLDLLKIWTSTLTITDAKKFIIVLISFFPWYSNFDVRKNDIILFTALMFSFGGISPKIGSKLLNYYGDKIDRRSVSLSYVFDCFKFNSALWTGDWKEMHYDEAVEKEGLLRGDLYNLVTYLGFQAHLCTEQGNRNAEEYLDRDFEISDLYDYDYGRLAKYTHGTLYLLKFRELDKAIVRSDETIAFIQKTLGNKPAMLMSLSHKTRIQILCGLIKDAYETMQIADELAASDTFVPYFKSFYTTTRLIMNLYKMEVALKERDKLQFKSLKIATLRSGKNAVKACKYAAFERVETYRLMGTYYWLTGLKKTALKWWDKSINEAERLGAKLELSRTYLETGKRLSGEQAERHLLNGISAEEYLKKARDLFSEMDLAWDLKELEQIR